MDTDTGHLGNVIIRMMMWKEKGLFGKEINQKYFLNESLKQKID